jgi:hypothetical protein
MKSFFHPVLASCLLFILPLMLANADAQAAKSGTTRADADGAAVSDPTVEYLEFFRRWDTPEDDAATRMFSRALRHAPDFRSFQALAPVGSEERRLFVRHLASFEEAGPLIRDGRMNEHLFFEAWYPMPGSWNRAKPYVLGMRSEANDPQLYREFEWLAQHSEQFWSQREKNPPKWQPIANRDPTPADRAIYTAFNNIWSTPRDGVARTYFAELQKRASSFEEFSAIVSPGSEESIKFDRVLCAYDQAGALIKNGILHPKLFFSQWQSPRAVWESSEPWVKGLRAKYKTPHLYDNVDWLVSYETEWRGGSAQKGR